MDLEIVGSVFSNNGNKMVFSLLLSVAMYMPFLGVLIAGIPLRGMGWIPHLKGKIRYVFFALWMPALLSIVGGTATNAFTIFSYLSKPEYADKAILDPAYIGIISMIPMAVAAVIICVKHR